MRGLHRVRNQPGVQLTFSIQFGVEQNVLADLLAIAFEGQAHRITVGALKGLKVDVWDALLVEINQGWRRSLRH